MFNLKKFFLTIVLSTQLFSAYMYDEPSLGNIAIEGGLWSTSLSGTIDSVNSDSISLEEDLGHKKAENINAFGLDLKNDYQWIPNIYINYFAIKHSGYNTTPPGKSINGTALNSNANVTSSISYSELNTILYGYLQRNNFKFDLGINFKKINYTQKINGDDTIITGPETVIPLPYIGISIGFDRVDLVLKAEASVIAFGDEEASDYRYSLNYRIMKHMFISLGYKFHHWETTDESISHQTTSVDLKGNYLNVKILF
jgi:outer membrane protein